MSIPRLFFGLQSPREHALHSTVNLEGLTLSPSFFADTDFDPTVLGYETVILDFSWDAVVDDALRTLTIRDLTVRLRGAGGASLRAVVGKTPASPFNDASAWSNSEIHSFAIRYDDNSLTQRIIRFGAQKEHVSPEDYVSKIIAALPTLFSPSENPDLTEQAVHAAKDFLHIPMWWSVLIDPAEPITISDIGRSFSSFPLVLPLGLGFPSLPIRCYPLHLRPQTLRHPLSNATIECFRMGPS